MPQGIQSELDEFVTLVKQYFGKNLKSIIVYGSYARGDYNESSDIDIMILVTLSENQIKPQSKLSPLFMLDDSI